MTVHHRSFVIERQLPGSLGHAFRFFSDHALKRRWTSCHPTWTVLDDRFDFRVDGSEATRWRLPDGTHWSMLAYYLEIAERERIVYAYTMRIDERPISSSLVTVEFAPVGSQTRMTFTEQAVFGDPRDADIRETGTGGTFDRLAEEMVALTA
jgi:uncharacterized protein YndB with AHSA1/START domain